MLASGHIVSDIKKEFIKNKTDPDIQPPPYRAKTSRDDIIHSQRQSIIESAFEEPFKNVGKNLRLNQSAMNTDKDKKNLANQKLEDLAEKADAVLLKVSTVFPFTFFVNDIIVDPYKVNVVFREFFYSEHIHSIMVKDILDVVVETSLFFATVKIVDQGYTENSVNISYLKKEDALKLRKIIQGLVIAHRQAVDLSVLNPTHIKDKAEELGKIKTIDKANSE